MSDAALNDPVVALVRAQGLAAGPLSLHPGAAGGNNRVYVVEGAAIPLVAKCYFRSTADTRDRLAAEWSFIDYAWSSGIRCVPRPVAADPKAQVALYERIDGRKLGPDEIGRADVVAAADFVRALNAPERRAAAQRLPEASDAAFSIAGHLAVVDRRIARLHAPMVAAGGAAAAFVAELAAAWQRLKDDIAAKAATMALPLDETLSPERRCVSPSDFGFHNALKRPDGALFFIDFEYAGWDDPAKLVADFFLQPQVSVDRRHADVLVAAAVAGADAAWHRQRVALLHPVFAVKWCCIMLNAFVAERAQAGRFANPALDNDDRKQAQLKKAQAALHALTSGETQWPM